MSRVHDVMTGEHEFMPVEHAIMLAGLHFE